MGAQEFLGSIAVVLAVMAATAGLEAAAPLVARHAPLPGRRRANLAMTVQALVSAFVLGTLVGVAAEHLSSASPTLMARAGMPAAARFVLGVVALDFTYGWAAHWTLHASGALWKYHRVHHSDAFVDVTTSYRTHPIEIAWRHLWLFATIWALGIPAAAAATFRVLSAVNGIFEHANVRVPPALDAIVARVWVTPNMHKVHHSRDRAETNSNYGNLLTLHDRVFGTFLPTQRALAVQYGLDDVRPTDASSFGDLLAMPWRRAPALVPHPSRPS